MEKLMMEIDEAAAAIQVDSKKVRTNELFDKYVAETVKLNQRLTMNDKFKYLITWVCHFS